MRYKRLMTICSFVMVLFITFFAGSLHAASQDDVMEKIRLLEIQIQQLKELKEKQKLSEGKEQQCIKAFGDTKFCKCIAEALPKEANFEQYIRFVVSGKETLKYEEMTAEAKKAVDASVAAREKCVDKGWFK